MQQDTASATAYTVLQGLLFTANQPTYQGLVAEETKAACRQILAASDEGKKRLKQLDSTLFNAIVPLIERVLMPGITLHYALRKRFIEDVTLKAIEQGISQVVNLGAGFDTLAWRLHAKHQNVHFIELDHPATNTQKAKALFKKAPTNLHLLAVDFSQTDAREALEAFPVFDKSRSTLFICEGVLMYLSEADVTRLFSALKQLTGSGTRFVFSALNPMNSNNSNSSLLLKLYLKVKQEPLNWILPQEKLADFLTAQDYQLQDLAGTSELRQRYLADIEHGRLHLGEYLALTQVN